MKIKIEKALSLVVGEYNQCKDNPMIRKPVSYALYKAWEWCGRNEEEKPPFSCEFCKYLGNPNYCPDKNGQMDLADYCSWGELKDEVEDGCGYWDSESRLCSLYRPAEEPRYCDRNICASNEVNGISCDECPVMRDEVTE